MNDWIVAAIFIVLGVPTAIGYGLMAYNSILTPERARDLVEQREREDWERLQYLIHHGYPR